MKATIDANILFSALIRKGLTRSLIVKSDLQLYAPTFILEELQKYDDYLLEKSKLQKEAFEESKKLILKYITLVRTEELKPYLIPASTLTKDEKDWLYLACALKENTILWSEDEGYTKQNRVPVKTITQLAKELGLI